MTILAEALFKKTNQRFLSAVPQSLLCCCLVQCVEQPRCLAGTCPPSPLLLCGTARAAELCILKKDGPWPKHRVGNLTGSRQGARKGTLPLSARSNPLVPWPPAAPQASLAGPGAADHFSAGY